LLQFTLSPNTLALVIAIRVNDAANAVLKTILPLTNILRPVRVSVGAAPMLLIVVITALVFASVLPSVDALPVHYSFFEITYESATVCPLEHSIP